MTDHDHTPSDVLLCLLRESPAAEPGPLADLLARAARSLGLRQVRIVPGDDAPSRDGAHALAALCRARLGSDAAVAMLDERELAEPGGPLGPDTVFYVYMDARPLPVSLDRRAKFHLLATPDRVEATPWPAGSPLEQVFLGGTPPAWTQHFIPESQGLQNELNKVRTVLRHRGEAGVPRDILITGPTGSGKSYFAKCLPALNLDDYDDDRKPFDPADIETAQSRTPFVAGNCASLSPDLADTLLFGAVKGAYTGCDTDRVGLIEGAGDGILFLDEVGELPLETQGKLLTALEERQFRRLGDTSPKTAVKNVTCTLVFGTNVDLDQAARRWELSHGREGFRRDLLWRINACHLKLPSFRRRLEGATTGAIFLEALTASCCRAFGLVLTQDARRRFEAFARDYPWNGNHRDAQHVFQTLKVKLLVQGMGHVVSGYLMRETLDEILGQATPPANLHPGADAFQDILDACAPPRREALERMLAASRDARTCADAGRAFYGPAHVCNHSDLFRKKLASFGLKFNARAPGHLSRLHQENWQ